MNINPDRNGQGEVRSTKLIILFHLDNYSEIPSMTRNVRPKLYSIPKEDQEQILLATWLRKQGIRFYAIPNGGKRSLMEAVKLKRMGVMPGIPDLCIPIPSGLYHGLYIELKRIKGGKVSDNQSDWLAFLREVGYYAEVARGFDEAKAMVIHYLCLTLKAA